MLFLEINEIPRPKKKLQKFLDDFIDSGFAFVEVIFSPNEYKDYKSCRSCMYMAAKRHKHNISVRTQNGAVYLVNNNLIGKAPKINVKR